MVEAARSGILGMLALCSLGLTAGFRARLHRRQLIVDAAHVVQWVMQVASLCWRRHQQPAQSNQIVRRHSEHELEVDLGRPPQLGLAHAADGLGPAEAFLDAFSNLQTGFIARMSRGSFVDGRAAWARMILCDVRSDVQVAQALDEARVS